MTISIKATRGNSGSGDPTSISGPTVIIKGATNTYTITDYDSFSVYEVTSSVGTVSRTNETITLMVATDEVSNTLQLTVSRDGNIVVKNIAIGAQVIATPNITSPASGSVDVSIPTSLLATAFTSYPTGADTHVSSDWRVKNTAGEIVWQSLSNTVDKTSITIPASNLAPGTQYFADVRYNGNVLGSSSYSPPVQFTTSVVFIVRPSITSPVSGATGVAATPTFVATAFTTNPVGSDTHASSDWRLKDSLGAIIWSSNTDTVNKTSITLPSGVLAVSSQYTMEVRYNGNVLQPSQWSPVVSFTTAAQFAYGKYLLVGGTPILYGQDVDTFNQLPLSGAGLNVQSVSFSYDGIYAAFASANTPYLRLQKRTGDTMSPIANPATAPEGGARGVSWTGDNIYLAVAHFGGGGVSIYKRAEDVLTKLTTPSIDLGDCNKVAFSKTGLFLAAVAATGNCTVFRRTSETAFTQIFTFFTSIVSVPTFSDDENYFCCGGSSGSRINLYKKNASSTNFARLADPAVLPPYETACASFSASGAELYMGMSSSPYIITYRRSGDVFIKTDNPASLPPGAISGINVSADGVYVACACSSASEQVIVYKRSGVSLGKLSPPSVLPSATSFDVCFYPTASK